MKESYELAVLTALNKSYAKRNLIDFTKYTYKKYIPNWHHFLLADRLELLSKGDIKRLAINMPPRHGKSELVSIRFPAWFLGNNPHKSIIAVSHNAKLAEKFGKKARNVVASMEFNDIFKHAKLSEESAAKLDWTLEASLNNKPCSKCGTINWHKKAFGRAICRTCGALGEFAGSNTLGEYYGAGIEGGITGRGADILIIDDPHKDRKEASSETIRNNVWDWYTSAAYQRLEESNCICICQTRWHEDDLTGKVLSKQNDDTEKWYVLSLKAIPDEDETFEIYNQDYIDYLGTNLINRKAGDVLWNRKYPLKRIFEIKDTIGSYEFNAQYQQDPQPDEGGLFKRQDFRYCSVQNGSYILKDGDKQKKATISGCLRFSTVDLNYIDSHTSDYTVVCTWDLTKDKDLILVNMFRKQVDGSEHLSIIWDIYNKLNPDEIGIESTQYQISLIQIALKDGLPVKELKAKGNKAVRALPASAMMEAHKIYILNSIPDIDIIENELSRFPNGKNDDIADNFSYAAIRATTINKMIYLPPDENSEGDLNERELFYQNLK